MSSLPTHVSTHKQRLALSSVLTWLLAAGVASAGAPPAAAPAAARTDMPRLRQQQAIENDAASFGYWGTDPSKYTGWTTHSNRLIPVYTFGTKGAGENIDLTSFTGENSPYRSEDQIRRIYGYLPEQTINPEATWMDQTNIADLQRAAAAAGRKYIFLVVFDGMDWQTTRAAAVWNSGTVGYCEGRGNGLHFLDYTAADTTQYGFMVTSPHNEGTEVDPDSQTVSNPGGLVHGGYDATGGGTTPWGSLANSNYLISKPNDGQPLHAYTDSAPSAASMTNGTKSFNGAINVDPSGGQLMTIAHELQQQGLAVGAVSSVPISHATPAAAYAHNVSRDDYQDLTRDMLGIPSVAHPQIPLPGLDVVIGGGFGVEQSANLKQGSNFVAGNNYLTEDDLIHANVVNGGRYITAVRTAGRNGGELLREATDRAVAGHHRLLGFFGVGACGGHLPFATADGRYDPVVGVKKEAEVYTEADLHENPSLAEMTTAAIRVLSQNENGFWLMVEPGDVDWANHDDNVDNSIGAVLSGDAAVRVITDWVEANSNWQESLLIVTADHGHMLNLTRPEQLIEE